MPSGLRGPTQLAAHTQEGSGGNVDYTERYKRFQRDHDGMRGWQDHLERDRRSGGEGRGQGDARERPRSRPVSSDLATQRTAQQDVLEPGTHRCADSETGVVAASLGKRPPFLSLLTRTEGGCDYTFFLGRPEGSPDQAWNGQMIPGMIEELEVLARIVSERLAS